MNTQQELDKARRRLGEINAEISNLEKQLNFEQSFGTPVTVYAVQRHDVSTGRLLSVLAVFENNAQAFRFMHGQYGWQESGLAVKALDFYPGRV